MEKKGLIWQFFYSLNPLSYDKLAEKPFLESITYVPKLLFAAFLIMLLVAVPVFMNVPAEIDSALTKMSVLNANITVEQDAPINIPITDPIVVIDRTANSSMLGKSKILITDHSIISKPVMCQIIPITCPIYDFAGKINEKDLSGYGDVASHKSAYIDFLTVLFFMLLPAILIISYVMFLIKYLAIAFIFAFLAFAITRMTRFEIKFLETLKISLYSLTLMILVEIVVIPLNIKLYSLHHALFLIFAILGILRTGYYDRSPKRSKGKKRSERGGYVELKG